MDPLCEIYCTLTQLSGYSVVLLHVTEVVVSSIRLILHTRTVLKLQGCVVI
jgi:hypothetical protein